MYDRRYTSAQLREVFAELFTDGYIEDDAQSNGEVTAHDGVVSVAHGYWILQGCIASNEQTDVLKNPEHGFYSIAVRLDVSDAVRSVEFNAAYGLTDYPQPVRSGDVHELVIAHVRVDGSGIAITDTRNDLELCGQARTQPKRDMPLAAADVLGAVKVGEGLNVAADGTLSVNWSGIEGDLAAEKQARQEADEKLSQDLATESTERKAADTQETADREAADTAATADRAKIREEFAAADTAESERAKAAEKKNADAIAQETADREAADTAAKTYVDGEIAKVSGNVASLTKVGKSIKRNSAGEIVVDNGNGLHVNASTGMIEVPIGEHLSYTTDGIDVNDTIATSAELAAETDRAQKAEKLNADQIEAERTAREKAVADEATARKAADDAEAEARAKVASDLAALTALYNDLGLSVVDGVVNQTWEG